MMYTRGTTGILPGPGGDSFMRWLGCREPRPCGRIFPFTDGGPKLELATQLNEC
jgi:hypothetical protein